MTNPDKKHYKRLKLDKFVAGREQRIFKTTTSLQSLEEETKKLVNEVNHNRKDVYYGEFNNNKLTDAKLINLEYLSGHLINFHDINADYISNRPDKNKILNFNR